MNRRLNVNLVGGDDTLALSFISADEVDNRISGVRVDLGSGSDACSVDGYMPPLSLNGDAGDDRFSFGSFTADTGNVSVLPGSGDDRVTFSDLGGGAGPTIQGKLQVLDADGTTRVAARGLKVVGRTSITTGGEADRVQMYASQFQQFAAVSTGAGDDVLDFSGTSFLKGKDIDGGPGDDQIAYEKAQ